MASPQQLVAQGALYAAFAAVIGYFSAAPMYTHQHPDLALIKLSFSHPGQRKQPCRQLTSEEIAKLAPNMRRQTVCARERLPVRVQIELDGTPLFEDALPPSGIARNGVSTAYARFPTVSGRHRVVARLRDSARTEGFDYERAADIELLPQQNFVIDFRAGAGGFVFR